MELEPEIFAKIAAPILSGVLGVIIKHYLEARSKIISFIGHASSFTVQGEHPVVIHTHAVVVRNAGRKAATNVRLSHAILPSNLTVYPPVMYTIERNPEGAGEIVFPSLVPKEQVTISYLYFPPLLWSQINVNAKSDEGFAKIISVIPIPQPSKFVNYCLWLLIFVGVSFLMYWLIQFVISIV
ncbi:hypothetical protein [Pseudomonas sp. Irchel s3a12]|uniref:hypothetical protein n=1 Tax=Pseudomonas sp. Irchel s3a12 TaxID=2009047 RepID=UPI0011407D4A|nr:hypothetical protein [Pseudomonas sp. Irchel s3a12]